MKAQKLFRQIHHWGSLLVMAQLGVVIGAGLLLMLKKELDWIQPPTVEGAAPNAAPAADFAAILAAAASVPQLEAADWSDLDRVEVRPEKGIVKVVAANQWEAQIDLATGAVLQVAYRRSDTIEALHDGSFFADWVKLYVFFPSGVVLLVLWATGGYLFFLPHWKRWARARRRPARRARQARDALKGIAVRAAATQADD